jgi:hypothetical protein
MQSVPPLQEVFDMAGMELPEILGKKKEEPVAVVEQTTDTEEIVPESEDEIKEA